jgi:uncharacterized protein YcfJ
MNKSLATGLIAGVVVATGAGAFAGYRYLDRGPQFAEVLAVEPVMKTVSTPREECHDESMTTQNPTKDPHRVTGTAIGAVVGGVLGNQVGGGSGKTIAKIGGAAAGGYAGNRIQKRMQERNTTTTTQQVCNTVYDKHEERVGYDVRYRLGEEEGTVRMDHEPGKQIPVDDQGQLILEPEAQKKSAAG